MLMEDFRTRRSCMFSTVMMSMKDVPYRLKSNALGRYMVLGRRSVFEYMRQAWFPKMADHILLLTSSCKTQR